MDVRKLGISGPCPRTQLILNIHYTALLISTTVTSFLAGLYGSRASGPRLLVLIVIHRNALPFVDGRRSFLAQSPYSTASTTASVVDARQMACSFLQCTLQCAMGTSIKTT